MFDSWIGIISFICVLFMGVVMNNALTPVEEVVMKRYILNPLEYPEAKCLDGSPPGIYVYMTNYGPSYTKYQILMEGGGWCYTENNCYQRSTTYLGSSLYSPGTMFTTGAISVDCDLNPEFCNWNKVIISYCDGNSHSGSLKEPRVVNGKKLYFRGEQNIDAQINELLYKFAMQNATEIMLMGCSAGGLGAILHANQIQELVESKAPYLKKFRVVPLSGMFPDYPSLLGYDVYPKQMRQTYALSQPRFASEGKNNTCMEAYDVHNQWKCNLAPYHAPFVKAPIFIINSVLDAWYLSCILTSDVESPKGFNPSQCGAAPGWEKCILDINTCSPVQIAHLKQFVSQVVAQMGLPTTSPFTASSEDLKNQLLSLHADLLIKQIQDLPPTTGAFLHTCLTHCEALSDYYYHIKAPNGVSMQQALFNWWIDDSIDAGKHIHMPCTISNTFPYQCDPQCYNEP